jgi:hypothetical protein
MLPRHLFWNRFVLRRYEETSRFSTICTAQGISACNDRHELWQRGLRSGFGSNSGITDLSSNSFQALVRIGVIYVEYIPL